MDTRAPPPTGPPPSYALISRVYQRSFRPIVLTTTTVGVIYAGLWGGSAFHDINDDKRIQTRIPTFDIIIGSLYMGVLVVEGFGFISAWLQRIPLVRLYTILSVGAALIVMAAELIRIVIHFMYKSQIINTCITSVTSSNCFAGFCTDDPLTPDQGRKWCNRSFSRGSWSDIAWFIAASIFSWLFASIAFSYLHQLLSVGTRLQPQQIRMNEFPTRYDPPDYPPPDTQNPYTTPYDGQKAPDYEPGYGAPIGGDKAPGYEYAVGGDKRRSDLKGVVDSDDEDEAEHGPRRTDRIGDDPFRS